MVRSWKLQVWLCIWKFLRASPQLFRGFYERTNDTVEPFESTRSRAGWRWTKCPGELSRGLRLGWGSVPEDTSHTLIFSLAKAFPPGIRRGRAKVRTKIYQLPWAIVFEWKSTRSKRMRNKSFERENDVNLVWWPFRKGLSRGVTTCRRPSSESEEPSIMYIM